MTVQRNRFLTDMLSTLFVRSDRSRSTNDKVIDRVAVAVNTLSAGTLSTKPKD